LLVYSEGVLKYEAYRFGFDEQKKHLGWSTAKSITTSLLGVAIQEGALNLDDPVTKYVADARNTPWDQVSLKHLATMTSGMDFKEVYEASPLNSHVVSMFYRFPFFQDIAGYIGRLRNVKAAPGERFSYSSGDTNMLSRALHEALGGKERSLLKEKILDKIGVEKFTFEEDGKSTIIGSSYFYATAVDFLKLGILYLNDGKWDQSQILPMGWAELSRTPGPAFKTLRLDNVPEGKAYGLGFWLNQPVPQAQIGKAYSAMPADAYWMAGHQGQYVIIIPSTQTVIVRLGRDRSKTNKFDVNGFFVKLSQALNWKGGVSP
ncbi:MAG: class C beta-lactamase-related serine hydrolase, partial [Proteobacteria bacterium]